MTESAHKFVDPKVQEYLVQHFQPLNLNMARVTRLVKLHRQGRSHPDFVADDFDDVLRSAVILLHAALEEFVRDVIRQMLCDKGISAGFIDVLIEKKTFNRVHQIKRMLKPLVQWSEETEKELKKLEATLDELATRRHEIAHRADISKGQGGAQPIDPDTVEKWRGAMFDFALFVLVEVVRRRAGDNLRS